MRLVRSWPAAVPDGRPHVIDGIDRFVMAHYDYRELGDLNDDVVLIEWDIALDRPQLETFLQRAADNPEQVRVAPYLLYPASTKAKQAFYCHKIREGVNRWVTGPDDEVCQMFGFGLVYLPKVMIDGFLQTLIRNRRFSDVTFSHWHWRHAPRQLRNVPIDWDCHAVHLHYDLPEVPQP
jgi:hypothetical protein